MKSWITSAFLRWLKAFFFFYFISSAPSLVLCIPGRAPPPGSRRALGEIALTFIWEHEAVV